MVTETNIESAIFSTRPRFVKEENTETLKHIYMKIINRDQSTITVMIRFSARGDYFILGSSREGANWRQGAYSGRGAYFFFRIGSLQAGATNRALATKVEEDI